MFSAELKGQIASAIQEILQEIDHRELPDGEINFLLHIDGAEDWSWANITNNNGDIKVLVPNELKRNTTYGKPIDVKICPIDGSDLTECWKCNKEHVCYIHHNAYERIK